MPDRRQLRILIAGEEAAGVQMFKALLGGPDEIVAVLTGNAEFADCPLAGIAAQLGYPVWPARSVKEPAFAEQVRSQGIDLLLNIHSLYVVHQAVLGACRIGAFNMHPGPLPKYAGLNTVSWAIYRGETSYGVTVHWMAPGIDTGDIAYQASFPIEENDTPVSLTHKCVKAGVPLVLKLLDAAAIGLGTIPRIRQDPAARQYFGKEGPESGMLSWTWPARDIVNFVRACDYAPYRSPWGWPAARYGGREILLTKAMRTHDACGAEPGTVGRCNSVGTCVAGGDEWVLVCRLKVDGRSIRPQDLFEPGTRLQDGHANSSKSAVG